MGEEARRSQALTSLRGVAIAIDGTRALSCARGWGPSLHPTSLKVALTAPLQLETLDNLPSPDSLEQAQEFINKLVITQRSGSLSFADVAERIAGCGAAALLILNSRPPSAAANGKLTGVDFRPCPGLSDGTIPVIGVAQEDAKLLLAADSVQITVTKAVEPFAASQIVREHAEDAEVCRLAMRCVHHESLARVAHGDVKTGQQLADAIILAMAKSPSDAIIAEYGAFNLGTLAFKDLIGADEVFEAIGAVTQAMEAHREIERVAAWCCRALTHIAMGGIDIKLFGGHLRVKDAKDDFPESADVQEWGGKALALNGRISASRDGHSLNKGRRRPGRS